MGPGRVCIFGTFDADRHPRVAVLEQGLRARGVGVARCNIPWRVATAARVAAARRPWRLPALAVRLLVCWLRLVAAARRVGAADVVLVGYLGVLDVHLARLLWRRAVLVLDHLAPVAGTMEDRFGVSSWQRRLAGAVDRAATRRADLVLVDTDEHLPEVAGRGRSRRRRALVVPVGATEEWFAAASEVAVDGPLQVVFFGLFTPLQGTIVIADAVRAALESGARLEVTMIGQGQDEPACHARLAGRAEVTWRPWVEAARLPAVVAAHHVCLGIFGTTAKARRVVPNKVYQGAAAGCAVVTSDTLPQRRVLDAAALFVPPGDAPALAGALTDLAGEPQRCLELRRRSRELAEAALRPAAVVDDLVDELGIRAGDGGGP